MLKEGRTYHIITKDGSELTGTVVELLTQDRVILEDVFILTELEAQLFVKEITLFSDDIAKVYDYETNERIL